MTTQPRHRVLCLALAAGALCTCLGAAALEGALPLAAGAGCSLDDDGARLWPTSFRETAPGVVFMEAELAPRLEFQTGQGPVQEAGASGGAWVAHVEHAQFPFEVSVAGTYQAWARAWLPRQATWNHMESMDDGPGQWVAESDAGVFGSWYWSRLGSYALKPGRHTFILHNWLGGARLDAVVLSADPALQTDAFTGPSQLRRGPERGTVTTAPLRPPGVTRWERLAWTAEDHGGRVAAEVSFDGGTTWQPAAADGALPATTLAGDGSDALVARLTLHAASDGRSPVVGGVRARYTPAADAEAVLENRFYRIAIARRTGALCGIEEKTTGVRLTPAAVQEHLFGGLAVREPGATRQTLIGVAGGPTPSGVGEAAAPADQLRVVDVRQRRREVVIAAEAMQGQIRVTATLRADRTALCRLGIEIDNRSALEVIRCDFPRLGRVAVGDWRDDEAILPQKAGVRVPQPATKTGRTLAYPGSASMAWMDLCDAQAGLYLAVNDRRLTATEFECNGARGRRDADMILRSHSLVAPGQTRAREFVLGIHAGDWHWAADRYREYAAGFMRPADHPEWVRQCDGWVGTGGLAFSGLGDTMDKVRAEGMEYIQQWGQMADGIDQCCGNFPWPAPALGGEAGYLDGIRAVHERGGRITGYCPSRLWTRDSAINDTLRRTPKSALPQEAIDLIPGLDWFERWRLYPLDGEPLAQYSPELGWYSMCPASTGWYEHQRQWIVEMIARRWGMDGVYIDELAAARAWPCYNLDHGHDDIGDWGLGQVRILEAVSREARRHNPDFCISIEGCGDIQGQYANLHLISGLCTHPEVFHYTFPEHILISGFSNGRSSEPGEAVSRAFLNGDRFDSRLGYPEMRSALALRQRVKHWLYPARFMDTLGLAASTPKVQARWNLCEQRGERAIVIALRNDERLADATCALELPKGWERPAALALFDREGGVQIGPARVRAGRLEFSIPASTLSAALVAYRLDPGTAIDAWAEAVGAPPSPELVVRASNLLQRPAVVTLDVTAEAPLQIGSLRDRLTVPERSLHEARVAVSGTDALTMPATVILRAHWPGGSRETRATFRPLLVNGSLDIDANQDGIPDGWDVGGTTRQFPYGIEDGAFWIQGQEKEYVFLLQNLDLKPNTAYVLSGRLKKSAQAPTIRIALAEMTGENTWRVRSIGDKVRTIDAWESFEETLTTGESFIKCQLYLYATHTAAKAWFDDIRLRPAAP